MAILSVAHREHHNIKGIKIMATLFMGKGLDQLLNRLKSK
jgi:hypothetical protein